uniref:Acyl-CoA thioester hydrolase n=1 Tax=Candidatus Kentrum eta TaxID=2126337 RepID=A0A450V4A7_9GAMM|nr:MAG: acyl-CoA thioester hydrolase [Candidatus Kentron sp. H]VFJ92981.1 MAG: acyl-CoA thioester hydrolase [Candidatus Kentron sp. H]VFJ99595.1 MAG: acyl-CoA thioester hydrolase [Candidatus Kentron sp. H]
MSRNHIVLPIRIYHEDTDDIGTVYYANYLKFMARARGEWQRKVGFEQAAILERHIAFPVRKVTVDFFRPARFDDMLMVGATLLDFGGAHINFEQKVNLASGELLCRGYVKLACIDTDTHRPRKIPPDFIAKLT